MKALIILVVMLLVVALIALSLSIRVVTQYEKGVLFRLGKVVGVKDPGLPRRVVVTAAVGTPSSLSTTEHT